RHTRSKRDWSSDVCSSDLVASPNSLHYDYVKRALENGKHVICEKPFTSTLRELEELIALSKKKGLFLFEAITTIHLPHFKVVRENLGRIRSEEHTSELQSRFDLVCRLLLEKKK